MSTIQDIRSVVLTTSLQGSTVTLRRTDFQDILAMQRFFDQVVGGDTLTFTDAEVLPAADGARWLAITGSTTDVLGVATPTLLDSILSFVGPDENVEIRLQGDYPAAAPFVLPVVDWLSLFSQRVVARLSAGLAVVQVHYEGEAGATGSPTTDPRFHLRIQKFGPAQWQLDAGGGAGQTRSASELADALRELVGSDLSADGLEALAESLRKPVPLSLTQLAALMGAENLSAYLPESLTAILADIALSGLSAQVANITADQLPEDTPDAAYALAGFRIPYFSIGFSAINGWDVLAGVSLKPGLTVILILTDGGETTIGQVVGVFALGAVDVPIFLQVIPGGDWGIGLQPEREVVLPNLSDLLGLSGAALALPPGLSALPVVVLQRLLITFQPDAATISRIDFAMYTASVWVLIEGYFAIRSLHVAMDVANLTGPSPVTSIEIVGVFVIGDTAIQCGMSALKGSTDWTFSCGLPSGETVNLTDVARALLPGKLIPENAPDLVFTTLGMTVTPAQSYLSFTAASTTPWTITSRFSISQFSLDFSYDLGVISGAIIATLSLAGLELTLRASLDDTPDGGWHFYGSTGVGQAIPIGGLLTGLAQDLGVTAAVPEPLQSLVFTNLLIEFSTQTLDFTLRGEASLAVGTSQVALTLDITLQHTSAGVYTKRIGGSLWVGAYRYDLVYSETAAVSSLLALYQDGTGQAIDVQALINQLSAGAGTNLPPMSFGVYQASFALSGGAYLFALNMESGINLSNLPLVGQLLPANETLRLEYQVTYASAPFSATTLGTLNSLMPTSYTPLPASSSGIGASSLWLWTKIRLGDTVANLDLPVRIDNQGGLTTLTQTPSARAVSTSEVSWVSLQRQVGPVHFDKVGGRVEGSTLTLLLNASLELAQLSISLDGLSVSSPLTEFNPSFDLLGLGIAYHSGDVAVEGAFSRTRTVVSGVTTDAYNGLAVIRVPQLSLAAMGSYTTIAGAPSLFMYGVLEAPLGGLPCFYVQGLAAGFGYNRAFVAPGINSVSTFPLVQVAKSGPGTVTASSVTSMLASLGSAVPPQAGTMFLSMGVKWKSFRIIDAFALATVQVGTKLKFDVLGLASAVVPSKEDNPTAPSLAVAELALRALVCPDDGVAGLEAQLTSATYIFTPECGVTGGFAVYAWFSGTKSGDFVLSLGGYHPSFSKPSHYPSVSRLGFTWRVSSALLFTGKMYCAVTPSKIMAGGELNASYTSGGVRVSFKADANFMMAWSPYYYSGQSTVRVHGSYTFETPWGSTKTISIDVGAGLDLWGPSLSGKIKIDLTVTTITVSFGNAPRRSSVRALARTDRGMALPWRPAATGWESFRDAWLPGADTVSVSVAEGLLGGTDAARVLDPGGFRLRAETAFPVTRVSAGGWSAVAQAPLGVRPMEVDATSLDSACTLAVYDADGDPAEDAFEFTIAPMALPRALWGQPLRRQDPGEPELLSGVFAAVDIRPKARPFVPSCALDQAFLETPATAGVQRCAWGAPVSVAASGLSPADRRAAIAQTISAPDVATRRWTLLSALGMESPDIDVAPAMADLFRAAPELVGEVPALSARRSASASPAAPGSVSAEVVLGGLLIRWLAVTGAVDYVVDLECLGGDCAAPVVLVSGTMATTQALPPGSRWRLSVRARSGDRLGPPSEPVRVDLPDGLPQPDWVRVINTPSALEVSWARVRGAVAYGVTVSAAVGYTVCATRVSGLFARIPADQLLAGETYKVRVEAIAESFRGTQATIVRSALGTPGGVSAAFDAATCALVVRWSPVDGAGGYEVLIFDASGRLLRPPSPAHAAAGSTSLSVDASALPAGARYHVGVRATAPGAVSDSSELARVEITR